MKLSTILATLAILATTATAATANQKYLVNETEANFQPGDNAIMNTLRVGTTLGREAYLEVGAGILDIGSEETVPVVAEIGMSKALGKNIIFNGDVEYMYLPEYGDHSATVTTKFFYLF